MLWWYQQTTSEHTGLLDFMSMISLVLDIPEISPIFFFLVWHYFLKVCIQYETLILAFEIKGKYKFKYQSCLNDDNFYGRSYT